MKPKREGLVPISELLPEVLEDMGLADLASQLRRENLTPIKGGVAKLEKHEDANAGMVVTDLETVPEEEAA